jgi:hypothetical protein
VPVEELIQEFEEHGSVLTSKIDYSQPTLPFWPCTFSPCYRWFTLGIREESGEFML